MVQLSCGRITSVQAWTVSTPRYCFGRGDEDESGLGAVDFCNSGTLVRRVESRGPTRRGFGHYESRFKEDRKIMIVFLKQDLNLALMRKTESFVMKNEIDTLFEKYKNFSGVISFYSMNKKEYVRAYGYSNINEQIKNNLDTKFGMASGSKIFTAIAILQLIEKGHLTLESKANDFLTKYRIDDSITIRHLLTHTSGVPDYFDEETMSDFEELWQSTPNYTMLKPEDFFPLFINNPNKFKPGSRFSYSNSGFILLSYILEQISKMSFINYIQKNIFDKCEMKNTGYFRFDRLPKDSAIGYIFDEGLNNYRSNIYSLPIIGGGDSGCYSCGYDMNIFWNALLDGKLLNKTILEEQVKMHQENDNEDNYGLGVWISKFNKNIVYVQGSDPGVKFFSYFNLKTRANFNVYTNINYYLGEIISDFLHFIRSAW